MSFHYTYNIKQAIPSKFIHVLWLMYYAAKGIQWNPYIADTIGELCVGRYRGLAVAEGFYKYYIMNEIQT